MTKRGATLIAWASWGIRLILGISFIWASLHKIGAPDQFAEVLYGYGLFPAAAINLLAIWVPFVELLAGICLVTGGYGLISRHSGLLVINAMLVCFILMISVNLIRGHEFDCGCFSFGSGGQGTGRSAAIQLLLRDILLLAGGLLLWRFFSREGASAHPHHPEA